MPKKLSRKPTASAQLPPDYDLAGWCALLAVSLLAYLPAINGGRVWDDKAHITAPALQSLEGLGRIWWQLGATQQYYPLLHSAFWFEHRLWGDSVVGYHLVNIVLHATSAFLLVLIVRRLAIPGAWIAGFLFALHPVCVEAVAWISEQKSTFSTVFYLASALVYLRFDGTRQRPAWLLALGLFICALLSKSVTATLPGALLVIFWRQRGRVDARRDALPLLPFFAIGASAGLFTAWVERTYIGAKGAEFALTLFQRGLLAGRVILFYLTKLIWPWRLTFIYPHWTIDPAVAWQYLAAAGAVALFVLCALAARRNRAPLAALLLFAGTLFPVLGFLNVYPFRYSYVADHFQYLAMLGPIVLAAAGIHRVSPRIVPVVILALFGLLTFRQSGMYRDEQTLYRETIDRNPDAWLARYNLADLLMPDHARDAIVQYRAALAAKPDLAQAHANLATALSATPGGLPEAIEEYRTSLRLQPDVAVVHFDLANALAKDANLLPEAVSHYREAIRLQPDYADAHYNLGLALSKTPALTDEAIAEYRTALRLKPDFAEGHISLGYSLSLMPSRLPDAVAEYREALRLDPESFKAHFNLAVVLSHIPGRTPEAIANLEYALRAHPNFAPGLELMRQLTSGEPSRK